MERFQSSIEVQASAQECYDQWHKFEEFPRFMEHVREVKGIGDNRYHWMVDGPLGRKLEWDADIDGDAEGKVISWHTTGEPTVGVQGAVRFDEIGTGQCRVTCTIQYEPPAGAVGDVVASIFANPQKMVEDDLQNFKQLMEGDRGARSDVRGEDIGARSNAAESNTLSGSTRDNAGLAMGGMAGTAGAMNTGDVGGLSEPGVDVGGYEGPYGLDQEEEQLDINPDIVGGVDRIDLEEETLPGIREEESPYLGAEGALPSEDLIDMRDDTDVVVESDVYTESMDVYGEDLESFTEDLDEDIDSGLTPRETTETYELTDDGSLVNQERPTESGPY